MEDNQFDADAAVSGFLEGNKVTAARAGVALSAEADADYEAHIKAVAQRNGVPIDTVREHPEEMKTQDKLGAINFDELATKNPVTTSTIGNFDKAKIVHDDIPNLGEIENSIKGLRGPEPTVANIATGLFSNLSFAPLHSAIKVAVHDAFNDDSSAEAQVRHNDLMRKSLQEQNVIDSQAPEFETATARGIYSGGASFMQALPATAASIATANPLPMMVSAGLQQGFPAYTKYLNRGATKSQAALGAVGEASAEVAFEALPMGFLVSKFGKVGAGEFLSGLLAREIPSEQATTVVQDAIDTAIANPDKSWDDFIKERPAAAYQTLLATVTQGGITGAISTVARKMYGDEKRSDSAESTALNLEQLHKVVAASKVLQRDPTIIHDFATEVSENGPVQNLYINAETLMQSGVAQKLSELLPSITEENIAEALATGGEIKIPVADYVTHIAGTDLAPELVDHLRVEGEDYTRAEAKDYMTNHASEMQAHVERVMAENQVTDEFKKSTEVVKNNIKAQLDQVSHFDSAVNDAYATMVSSFYAVQAAQLGTTAEDLFAKYPLTVNGHNFGGQQYDQGKPITNTTELGDFKTGVPVSFDFSHNTASATAIFGKPKKDAPYDRGIEPSGRYVSQVKDASKVDTSSGIMSGTLSFKNPLVLNVDTWKRDLFNHYKKRGKALSKALIADGYDGVVTIEHDSNPARSSTSEILDLTTFDEDKALYQSANDSQRLAPNGKPSNLNPMQWLQVRTEAFKKWFGDWEALAKQNEIDAFIDNAMAENDPRGSLVLRDVTEAERDEVLRQGGPDISGMQHVLDAQEIKHANKRHGGKDEKVQQPDQRPLTIDDLKRIAAVIDGYDDIKVQPRGKNKTSLIYSREFPDGKIEYVERVFETSEKHKPRLVTKTVWVKVTTGVKPSPTQVYTPDHDANLPFKGGRVNPDLVSKVVDENGEPLVVYHGTDKSFSTINMKKGAQNLFWFTSDKSSIESGDVGANGSGKIMELYVKINSPANWHQYDQLSTGEFKGRGLDGAILDKGDNEFDGFVLEGNQVKSANGKNKEFGDNNKLLHQNNIDKNRGSFNPSTNTITLLKDADLSTFLHETGHFFLETQFDIAARMTQEVETFGASPGQQSILKDTQALLDWFGVSDLDTWHNLDFEEKRHYHEQFARGFEQYLGEGKAPSLELHALFQRFRSWILNVYKELKNLNVKLSPEVRGVMDRLIASEEQIKLAEQGRSMMPLFESAEQAGMTEQEFAEYQQLGEDATNAAIDVLSSKATSDMQWLSNARAKSLKKMQRQHDELRRNVRSEVRTKVMSQPVYQAWSFLTRKLSKDDKINPQERPKSNPNYVDESQDSLFVAIAKLGGLVRKDIESEWGLGSAEKLKAPVFGKHVLRRNGGMAIDDMGQSLMEHGYLTPDEHGKFDQREFEEKFGNELRGQLEYSSAFASDVFAEEGKAGEHIANPWALNAGRIELSALKGMMLPAEIEQRIIDLKMTAKDGLDADVVSDIIPGFSSGDELVRAIAGAENPRDLVERMTDQTMLERHSELATPEAVQKAADEAIHNDVRARFVTREANALAQASGGTKLLASAAKEYAASIIARLKIRNIKPFQYTLAETRAAKLAEKASKAGDIKKAAAEKRNQAINLYAAKAAYDALDEVDKILRYFKKFNGDNKKVDIEYLDQIRGLLAKFDLRKQSGAQIDETGRLRAWVQSRLAEGELPIVAETLLNTDERKAYVAQIESRDEHGELVYADDEERLKLLADAIDRSATRSYKEATFEELQGLSDTIKQIEHLGRLKNKLLTSQDKRNFEEIRDDITGSIMEHGGLGNKNTRTPNDILGKFLVGIKDFGAAHIKVATWARIMDGGLDNGPVWRFLVKPANERASQETTMRAKATADLDAILRPILKKLSLVDKSGKGRFFPSIGTSLNWQERFAILLNMGNESNLQRLMAGGIANVAPTLTMKQILDVVNTMSPEEIYAAQAVWDHFESYREQIAAKERRVSGIEPKWIPIRAIDIKANDGSIINLRGGYYPVKFDSRVNIRAEAHASAQEAKDLMKASYSAATTNRSFTKERVEEVHGRPLLLNMTGLYSGVNDVIHDLAWHEWVIDANKILRSSKIDEAIRAFYGPEVKKQFDNWRNDIVIGQRRLDHGIEKAAGVARQFVSGSALTFNLISAAMQPLGLSNSIARIGAEWVGKGVARYVASPKQATIEAQEKSEWMANRTRTRFRELNELRNQVQGQTAAKEIMGRYGYWLMMKSQMTVDVPTWWGGYEKGIAEGYDEATAIALADQGVKDSQGGGEEVDQSGIERGHALVKLFTAFYGFMGTTLNTAVGSTITEKSKAKIAANLLLTLMVPAVFGSLLRDALTPDSGDDDDDGMIEKLIREQISFLMGMIAFGREFSQMANPKSMGYSGPTGLRVIPDIYHLKEQIAQGEFDDAFRKQFINVLGDLTGLPAVQINRTITGTTALVEGKTDNPMAIGFGFKNK